MSIFELFGRKADGSVQTTANAAPAQTPAVADPGSAQRNTTVPNDGTQKSDGTVLAIPAVDPNKSPLDKFGELWQLDPKVPGPASLVPTMKVDAAKVMEAAKRVDFSKIISPELVQKATSGDQAAFLETLNLVTQSVYGQAAIATTQIVETALAKMADTFHKQVLPEALRRHDASVSLTTENPVFLNPAVQPVLKSIETQLALKHPNAPAAEITSMARDYFTGLADELVKQSGRTITDPTKLVTGPGTVSKPKEEDWERFFAVPNVG